MIVINRFGSTHASRGVCVMSSVLPIAVGGMTAAMARFQTAATDIASGSGDLEQAAIELMMSKINLQAEARVAEVITQAAQRLLDITA
jgi:hypothetical protein